MDNLKNQLNDTEVDSSSASQQTSIENPSSDNVRNRVSSWLTEIVGEVRKKSVTVTIPKWIDASSSSISAQISTKSDDNQIKICDNINAQKDSNINSDESVDNNLIHDFKKNTLNNFETEAEINIPSTFWYKFNLNRNRSPQNQGTVPIVTDTNKVFQIKSYGKNKINEIYEKVKLNKEKITILSKSSTIMDEEIKAKEISVIQNIGENVKDSEIEDKNEIVNNNNNNNSNSNTIEQSVNIKMPEEIIQVHEEVKDEFSDSVPLDSNTNLNIFVTDFQINEKFETDKNKIESTDDQNKMISFNRFQRNLKLAELGRSSTLNPKYLCHDDDSKYSFPANLLSVTPIEEEQISTIQTSELSSTPNFKSKRYLKFGGMCRSFSEQKPDVIDESDELLNEKSQSCYHVIEEENFNNKKSKSEKKEETIIQNIQGNNKNDGRSVISTSLPTFSTNSILQQSKNHRKEDSSSGGGGGAGGDSSSSICMDISPCGSGSGTSTSDTRDLHLRRRSTFIRDNSYQSDSSHCSSVDSLLESRKPDPESILINLGFGPIDSEDILAKIPKRFLKPSQVRGIDTEAFLKRQQLMNSIHDHSVLGYRGLLGNPDIPPSHIVGKIMERFEQNEINRWHFYEYNRPQSAPPNSTEIQKFQYNT